MKFFHQNKKGLGMMEMVISIGVFLLLVVVVSAFITRTYGIQRFSFGQAIAISEASRGVDKLVKEVREALPGDTGDYAIDTADDFSLIFYVDYDRDQAIEKVKYYLDGSNFVKTVIEPSGYPLEYNPDDEEESIISRYVRNESDEPVFTYYDGDYSGQESDVAMITPADVMGVKLVHIYLKINVYPDEAPTDFNLESDAQVRNLKNNL